MQTKLTGRMNGLTHHIVKSNLTMCIKLLAFQTFSHYFHQCDVSTHQHLTPRIHTKIKLTMVSVFWNLTPVVSDLSPKCQCHNVTGQSLSMFKTKGCINMEDCSDMIAVRALKTFFLLSERIYSVIFMDFIFRDGK